MREGSRGELGVVGDRDSLTWVSQHVSLGELDGVAVGSRSDGVVSTGNGSHTIDLDGRGVDFKTGGRLIVDFEGGILGVGRVVRNDGFHLERDHIAHAVLVGGLLVFGADTLLDGHIGLLDVDGLGRVSIIGSGGIGHRARVDDHVLVDTSLAARARHAHKVVAATKRKRGQGAGSGGAGRRSRTGVSERLRDGAGGILHVATLME